MWRSKFSELVLERRQSMTYSQTFVFMTTLVTRAHRITELIFYVNLGGLVVVVLVIEPKVHGFRPDQGQWIFKGDKSCSTTSFGGK
jgi:hypothetical protein